MPIHRPPVLIGSVVVVAVLGTIGLGVAFGGLSSDIDNKPIPYNTSQTATAKCPANQHVAFGGFKIDTTVGHNHGGFGGANGYTWLEGMGPKGGDTDQWTVTAENSGSDHDGKVTSYGYCRKGAKPKVVKENAIVLPSAANDQFRNVKAKCPDGKNVIGGGWSAKTATLSTQHYLDIMGLQRTADDTWQVSVVNDTGEQQKVTAIAVCGKGKAPKMSTDTEHIPAVNVTKTAVATCPEGTNAMFGGFRGDSDSLSGRNAFAFSFSLQGDDAIAVHGGQNYVGDNHEASSLTAFAYCK